MPRRPVFYPELGAFFLALREERGWNQSEAASLASRRQLSALTRQVLLRLEKGKTKNPEPDVLRDLAAWALWRISESSPWLALTVGSLYTYGLLAWWVGLTGRELTSIRPGRVGVPASQPAARLEA